MNRAKVWGWALLILGGPGMAVGAGEADLIPIAEAAKDGRIGVKNQGAGEAGPSVLTFTCVKADGGECPQSQGMKDYRNPDYPDKLVVMVPSLPPGEVYMHSLRFWPELKWAAGGYSILLFADAGDNVKERDESNNIAVVYRREGTADVPAAAPSGATPPAAKATAPVRTVPPPPAAASAPPPAATGAPTPATSVPPSPPAKSAPPPASPAAPNP